MAQTSTTKTVEFSSGVTGAMVVHQNTSTEALTAVVQTIAGEVGGLDVYSFSNAASNNAQVVKAAAGNVYGWFLSGISPEANYLKFYNLNVSPTVGTSTIKMRVTIPKAATAADGVAVPFFIAHGVYFDTGIAIAMIESIADTGTTAMDTADEVLVNIFYK